MAYGAVHLVTNKNVQDSYHLRKIIQNYKQDFSLDQNWVRNILDKEWIWPPTTTCDQKAVL
jgi:hypothetical protein